MDAMLSASLFAPVFSLQGFSFHYQDPVGTPSALREHSSQGIWSDPKSQADKHNDRI